MNEAAAAPDPRTVREALRAVIDPEVGLDIVTLGLVYEVEIEEGTARVRFTLTTPGCPLQGVIVRGVTEAALAVPGIERVEPELVWEPRWNPEMIEEEAWKQR
ncbi:MAG: metal-sulfur cluster assembly factor [Gemmatimonadota bacterium]